MLRLVSEHDLDSCKLDKWGILDPGEYENEEPSSLKENAGEGSRIRRKDGMSTHPHSEPETAKNSF